MPLPIEPATPDSEVIDEVLRDTLEAHGHRFTEQRASVYRFLSTTTEHPTADEVFTAVRGHISDISLATVYKALETLVTCGLVSKLTYGDGSARYDFRTEEHLHIRCLGCGIVRDLHTPDLDETLPRIEPPEGFTIEGWRVEVVGYCASCAH